MQLDCASPCCQPNNGGPFMTPCMPLTRIGRGSCNVTEQQAGASPFINNISQKTQSSSNCAVSWAFRSLCFCSVRHVAGSHKLVCSSFSFITCVIDSCPGIYHIDSHMPIILQRKRHMEVRPAMAIPIVLAVAPQRSVVGLCLPARLKMMEIW